MKFWLENIAYLGLLLFLLFFVHLYVSYEYLLVAEESKEMEPLIKAGTFHLVRCTGLEKVERTFLVFFPSAQLTHNREKILRAARVIALPGEEIAILAGKTYINKQPFDESYAQLDPQDYLPPLRVPERHFFVMVDHRSVQIGSRDSRSWGFLPFALVAGFSAP